MTAVLVASVPRRLSSAPALPEPEPGLSRAAALVRPLEAIGVVLAVELAVILRVADLGQVGLNSDEAVYASQAASLAGNPHFTDLFPVVRAHPLLLQVLMSPMYRAGVPDTVGRYVAAAFGVATVLLVYVLGRLLYDRWVGVGAALLLAVMPYHVTVSRQILLDGPMTFFTTAALLCLALAARTDRRGWLLAAGSCIGLAALSKETGVILIGGAFVFLSFVPRLWRPLRSIAGGAALALGIALSYPIITALAGGGSKGQSYLLWQLTRHPNHSIGFYLSAAGAMGALVLAVGFLGLLSSRWSGRRWGWPETMLLSWLAVPVLFFEVWPVKGYSYLTPVAPVVAVLAARALIPAGQALLTWRRRVLTVVAVLGCVTSLAVPSAAGILHPATSGVAGTGGLPGGRGTGLWVAAHVPEDAQLMTIGPSMANLIQYYSGRHSDGLSVSPNPLHRNPSYRPILNPDAALRAGTYQYIVWDAYSGRRTAVFTARALELVARFHGREVHTERGTFSGKPDQPLVVIYQVTP